MTTGPAELLAEALATRADEIARRVHAGIAADIPTYDRVPRAEVQASVVQIVHDVGGVIRAGAVPAPPLIVQAEESSRARAKQGVPIHDIMHAFRFSMGAVRDAVAALAEEVGLDAADTVDLLTLLWSYSDAYTANVVAVYRQSDIENALDQARRSQQFLLGLLDGTLEGAALTLAGTALLLDPDTPYRALRAQPASADPGPMLQELQRQVARHPGVAVVAAIGAHVVGVVPFRPEAVADQSLIALGPAVRLDRLDRSFRTAQAVLTASTTLGLDGVLALEDLSWRMAAAHAGELNGLLRERYLAPLDDQGEFGALVREAVAVYLAEDRSVPRAARALPVHPNTLRYRLRRFEELTGCSLDSTETIVEVSFALGISARTV
ncbi:putative transposase [Actinomycetospora succinea]|uniref:Putative transposase n=1 Tax=Actinomycetospora succinea TaxID=663603 RepID=A0A4R6VB84_9PSEU|nr:helix-turn-helix domain-containing protein [Actinomycetospora succinea]TDQ58895.1 putative transposase [Actinomycetospora succinea]